MGIPDPHWYRDGDVNLFPDKDGDGDGDETEERGWGWKIRSPKFPDPLPSLLLPYVIKLWQQKPVSQLHSKLNYL
ncbi:hypothetical protein Tco_0643874 [Tanacetum coccineum]|uniref:Uncharacterized protein n=1 Tax=Tanacetum coccineum TaxID=301880 RepID=A0ABQ4X078_9ASTR